MKWQSNCSCTCLQWAYHSFSLRSRGGRWIQARQLVLQPVELVQGCFVFGNDAQRNANKGTEHLDERPLTLLDTKNVLTKLLTSQTVSLYLTRAIGPLSSNKSSTHRLPLQNAMRVQVIFLEKFARKTCGDISYRYIVNAKRAAIWNYQFLARGNSRRKIFGSWWLVVARGRSWWLGCCFRFDPFIQNPYSGKF